MHELNKPLVSILMAVYNGEKYLHEAIKSILTQTYTNFEFLIINDGSNDSTEEIILSYSDERIRYLKNEQNLKLISSLNKGFDLAKGKYLARIDADDISLGYRIEKQVDFMECNLDVGLLGSNILDFKTSLNYSSKIQYLEAHDQIKFNLFFDTHFPHPAAFIRTDIIRKYNLHFDSNALHAEDYELWNRMANFTRLHILQDYLVAKRSHIEQISTVHRQFQIRKINSLRSDLIKKIFFFHDEQILQLFNEFLNGKLPTTKKNTLLLLQFITETYKINNQKKYYNDVLWENFCKNALWHILSSNTEFGADLFTNYKNNALILKLELSRFLKFKWFIKSVFRISIAKPIIYYAEQ